MAAAASTCTASSTAFSAFSIFAIIEFSESDSDGADGTLEGGGANIAVTDGTYDIVLDVANNTYTLTKK